MSKLVKTTVTFLQMTHEPKLVSLIQPHHKVAILRAENPTLHFYRYLYNKVGAPYSWVSRKMLSDDELTAIIHHDNVEIYVLHVDDVPAGFAEIDWRNKPRAGISFFGLIPEFIGEGFGAFFLHSILRLIWVQEPDRVTIETCTLDHPKALPLYQRMGFEPYAQEVRRLSIPD
jgi:GNAT superfamily N-acetyltransferase